MNYEQFIKTIKKETPCNVPEEVWDKLSLAIQRKPVFWHWEKTRLFPVAALTGIAASFIVFFCLQQIQYLETKQYIQMVSSTEYIYDLCKYPVSSGTILVD